MHRFVKSIVTFFGAGLFPKAPGTAGSLAALLVVIALFKAGLMYVLPVLTVLTLYVGVWSVRSYITQDDRPEDPKEVVIDEVVGQWLVFAIMPLMYMPAISDMFWSVLGAGFVAFRFFDIVKPWPISLIDRRMKGAWGIMLDDVLAAVFALVTMGVVGHVLL